jgi:hypothetical protein
MAMACLLRYILRTMCAEARDGEYSAGVKL